MGAASGWYPAPMASDPADDGLVDLHSHYLPWVDDGAADLQAALGLLKAAEANGIVDTVLTPHVYPGRWDNALANLEPAFASFRSAAASAGVTMRLHLGAEVHLLPETLEMVAAGNVPYIGGHEGRHVMLLELPDARIPVGTENAVRYLLRLGVVPMIAHPERNKDVMRDPTRVAGLVREGCLVQLTAASVCGWFGRGAHSASLRILDEGWATVVATDAHNLAHRPPVLADAFDALRRRYGEALARELTIDAPGALLRGRLPRAA